MKGIVLDQPGSFRAGDFPDAGRPDAGEALVRVHRVGVCGTDYHAFRGTQPFFSYPRVLGHELGVEVVEVGPGVAHVRPGDRCCVEPYFNCGKCIACRNGKGNCCADLRVFGVHVDGGMREYVRVPARKLHKSDTLAYDQLALVEMLGIGAHAVARAQLKQGETVLVVGAGPIGLSVVVFAVAAGARVIVADVNESRLAFCRKHFAVAGTIGPADGNLLEALKSRTDGDLATAVLDATGNAKSMMGAFQFVAPGGRLVFVGLFQGDVTFNDPFFHKREMTLLASRNALPEDFENIIRLMETGVVDTSAWITHRCARPDVVGNFEGWLKPEAGVVKAMIEF